LGLLPDQEQQPILSKYHFHDACMSLGSALLKRAYIVKSTGIEWDKISFDRKLDARLGKPCWLPPPSNSTVVWPTIDFNVSHQKGLVLLVGICLRNNSASASEAKPQIAVDVVSPHERNDMATIATSGLEEFIETFSSILSDQESFALTYTIPSGSHITLLSGEQVPATQLGRLDRTVAVGEQLSVTSSDGKLISFESDLIIDEKVRSFYANFSLKEAFMKMGGEGLAAPWIRECEFHHVRAPAKGALPRCSLTGVFGERITNDGGFEITLDGKTVTDVKAEIQSFEEDYIFSTMLRPASISQDDNFPEWESLSLENDILPLAQR
jgi:4'-phosphopantetheinyl transferase